ncbi:hypothetical protein [Desulfobacter curvatus]|nr:hypothetical protein [Desulfobacter curvatus]
MTGLLSVVIVSILPKSDLSMEYGKQKEKHHDQNANAEQECGLLV